MQPLSSDLLDCPCSCSGPGRSEKCTGQPCGVCWKVCPLMPLFLTSFFFCSISTLLLFHTFCVLLPSSSRNPSTAFIPGTRDLVFWQKAAETNKKNPSVCFSSSCWSAVALQRCANSIGRWGASWSFSFCSMRASIPLPWEQPCGLASPPTIFWSFSARAVLHLAAGAWILLFPVLLAWLLSLCPSCCFYCSLSLVFLQLLSSCYSHTFWVLVWFFFFPSSPVLPPPLVSLPFLRYLVGKRCFHTSGSCGVFDACICKLTYIFFVLLVPCCIFQVAYCW